MLPKAEGLSFAAMRPLRVVVDQWYRAGKTIATGTLEYFSGLPRQAQVKLKAKKLVPVNGYRLMVDGDIIKEATADKYGKILFAFKIEQRREVEFKVLRN